MSDAPVADFSADPTSVCVGYDVYFTDLSSGEPTSWSWDFGDGANSTDQNPSHSYSAAGSYDVSLTVSNDCGEDDATDYVTITVSDAPVVDFEADPTSVCVGYDVYFTDLSTGEPTSWRWDFGDGATSASQNPSHSYSAAGSYDVSLTVFNDCGEDDATDYVTITVSDAPVADFSADPTSVCVGSDVYFTDLSTGEPTSWSWDFGDGATSASQNPSHSYSAAGSYDVSLTVFNDCGEDDATDYVTITVSDAPVADFSADPTSVCVGYDVYFTDLSSGEPTSWSWDFGDGATSASQNPSHSYSAAGSYDVSLTVSNDCGEDDATDYVTITVSDAPVADFSADPTSVCVGYDVYFTDLSSGEPTSWSWDFGDGATSTDQNPSHSYSAAGSYDVSLTVSNDCGEDDATDYVTITVSDAPVADFSGRPHLRLRRLRRLLHRSLHRRAHLLELGLRRRRHQRQPEPLSLLQRRRLLRRLPHRLQ